MNSAKIKDSVAFPVIIILFFCGILLNTYAAPLIEYDFKEKNNNSFKNRSSSSYSGIIIGKPVLKNKNGRSVLELGPRRDAVVIADSEKLNITTGMTFCATVKFDNISCNSSGADKWKYFASIFYKEDQFIFSRRGDQIYFNFKDKKAWTASLVSTPGFSFKEGKFYHLAMSLKFHNVPSQGEVWTVIKIYADGKCVGSKKVMYNWPENSRKPIEIGQATNFGRVWHLDGAVAHVAIYDHVLSKSKIQHLVQGEKLVQPAFRKERKNSQAIARELQKLQHASKKRPEIYPALLSAMKTLAMQDDDEKYILDTINSITAFCEAGRQIKKISNIGKIKLIQSSESLLVVLADPQKQKCRLLSFFDLKTKREILSAYSKLWSAFFLCEGAQYEFSSLSKGLKGYFTPSSRENAFEISWVKEKSANNPVAFTVKSNFTFDANRLEYDFKVKSRNGVITNCIVPDIELCSLAFNRNRLLIPRMSGAEIFNPIETFQVYSGNYPTGIAAMQMGAYYDDFAGIYFATEDPRAQAKSLAFIPEKKSLAIQFKYSCGYKDLLGCNEFDSRSKAVIELFRGNWYEAGMIYCRFLKNEKPPWVSQKKATPQWFKNNLFWILDGLDDKKVVKLKKIKEYLGLPFAFHWYFWHGKFDRDYPHHRSTPEVYNLNKKLTEAGIRTVLYTNGRLWETKDRRLEDWQFTKSGKPNAVYNKKGQVVIEHYAKAAFAVMCPATAEWSKRLCNRAMRILSHGHSGVYYDQIAAARPRLCYNSKHGHLLNDGDAWYMQGYLKIFEKLRSCLEKRYPDAVLTSEDMAEPYVGLFDGLLPWRWMYNNSVPLFPLVYGNKVQLTGRYFAGEEAVAVWGKLAEQLINGEQIGWLSTRIMCAPGNFDLRLFIKKIVYIRKALLPFFNIGQLGQPLKFTQKLPRKKYLWGIYGDKFVAVPPILSNSFYYKNMEVFVLVNYTAEKQKATLVYDARKRKKTLVSKQLYHFNSITSASGQKELRPYNFEEPLFLPPRSIQVLLVADAATDISSEAQKLKRSFDKIVSFNTGNDPFFVKNINFKDTPGKSFNRWYPAVKAPRIIGANTSRLKNCVNNISTNSYIYWGTYEFGDGGNYQIESYFAVPDVFAGGTVKVMVGHPYKGKEIASFKQLESTSGWNIFKPFKTGINLNDVKGKQKVFMLFNRDSLCNVRQMNIIKK